jgi:ATP-binding cassette subfamily C (CFTR/MRP) protein 1
MSLANFMGSVGSFHRIQEFLNTEVRVDNRKISHPIDLLGLSQEYPYSLGKPASSKASGSITNKSQLTLQSEALQSENLPDYPVSNAVVVQDGSFGWDKDKSPILPSISFTIPREKFTMIVGPVGCGKSTLIKALLGEAFSMGGTIHVSSPEIAFCDQTAWHMNVSIQQSIIGVSKMDTTWYKSVIHACALETDLKRFPQGDRTVIGSSGVALSGGQSQRIVRESLIT